MPDLSLIIFIVTVALALSYAYYNGANDAANAIAPIISTRVMTPLAAVLMGGALNLVGALSGTAVAKTIGSGIVDPSRITSVTAMGAILGAVLWVLLATRTGFPVSVSHSLVASLVGAGLATAGPQALHLEIFVKVLAALALSPLLGFLIAFLAMLGLYWLLRKSAPSSVRRLFSPLQILAGAFLAYSHGKNDGQNAIGIIALGAALYYGGGVEIELWMILASGLAIGLGTGLGGMRVIRTLGMRVTYLEPVHGFAASTAGALIIEVASGMGLPVSTTHTAASSIMGVGATKRLSAVRWGVTRSIVLAWLVTYPVCFVLGGAISVVLGWVF